MKKLLALVLALVMTLSLATVGTNAFTDDAKINENYAEAVQVLNGMGVFKGYEDKSFRPEGDITRAEVAAIVYRIYTGDVKDAQAAMYAGYGKFDDVATNAWYAGYVGYCTNAAFIKGYGDGKFGPNDKVTGYQALAMILRAVGYGKNGEFEGKDWELHVAQVAQQIGALVNTQGEVLKNPASRQLVAELLFRCLQAPQVTYTPAFGYTPVNGVGDKRSLGQKVFDLKEVGEIRTDYGRPAYLWTYKTGDKSTVIPYKPLFTATVATDECDIAKALGLSRPAYVAEAWLDGVDVTATTHLSGSNDYIDLAHPGLGTNLVGDQGRITEIYAINGGLSIVEINTYFGVVDKVYGTYTDKNGHKTTPYIDLTVFLQDDKGVALKGVQAEGFAAGDYVLVTLDRADNNLAALAKGAANRNTTAADVATVVAAKTIGAGSIAAYSQRVCNDITTVADSQGFVVGTVTIGKTKYNDADKFYVGYPTKADTTAYDIYDDGMGNVIALVPAENIVNFAVINAIRWNSPNMGTTIGGYVTANLTFADGTVANDVVVARVNGVAPRTADNSNGQLANATVSNAYYLNDQYYGHIVTYSVNDNGQYNLYLTAGHTDTKAIKDGDGAKIVKGKSTLYITDKDQINVAYADNTTVFLVANGKYGYDVYVGYNKVPTINADSICYLVVNGRVKLAVINGDETENTEFAAYLPSTAPAYVKVLSGKAYNVFRFYKIGSTEITEVLVPVGDTKLTPTKTGFYNVELTDGAVVKLEFVTEGPDTSKGVKDLEYAGHTLDTARARTAVIENAIATTVFGAENKNYSNMVDAKYFLAYNGFITEAAYTDISAMDIISVIYDEQIVKVGGTALSIYTPVYVYLAQKSAGSDSDTDIDQPTVTTGNVTIKYTVGTVATANNVVIPNGTTVKTGSTYTFVVIGGATAPTVKVETGTAVLALVASNTVNGTYTYELRGIDGDVTVSID